MGMSLAIFVYNMSMSIQIILYLHILAATAWIGGSLFLFVLGISIRNKETQEQIYERIGPLYGYSESLWLLILLASGLSLFFHFNLYDLLMQGGDSALALTMSKKLYIVALISVATIVHMTISLKSNLKERTLLQKLFSRGSSLMIFLLNLLIIWFAISLRTMLT